jgi:predicted amino acid-binding ACT domain protein
MRMEKKILMTAFCKDRPGIVADITEIIFQAGCNLEDSTMTSMLDEFAIILFSEDVSPSVFHFQHFVLCLIQHGNRLHLNHVLRQCQTLYYQ